MRALGFLDEYNFYLMHDDHDLHCRALTQHGWLASWVWSPFESKVAEGGVRLNRGRTNKTAHELQFVAARRGRSNGAECYHPSRPGADARQKAYAEALASRGVESERSWPLKTLRGCGTAADLEWTDA